MCFFLYKPAVFSCVIVSSTAALCKYMLSGEIELLIYHLLVGQGYRFTI